MLIHFADQWYRVHLEPDRDRERLDARVLMIQPVAVGARAIVSVMAGGFLILSDQLRRVGDAVWIEPLDRWRGCQRYFLGRR